MKMEFFVADFYRTAQAVFNKRFRNKKLLLLEIDTAELLLMRGNRIYDKGK